MSPDRPVGFPSNASSNNVPQPAGITVPSKVKARALEPAVEIVKDSSSDTPPYALSTLAPSTVNCQPPRSHGELYKTFPSSVKYK
jgi:hypothetical protein